MRLKLIRYRKHIFFFLSSTIVLLFMSFILDNLNGTGADLSNSSSYEILVGGKYYQLYRDTLGLIGKFIPLDIHLITADDPILMLLFGLILGSSMMHIIYHLTIYKKRRIEKNSLYLGLFSMIIIMRFFMTGQVVFDNILRVFHWRTNVILYCLTAFTHISFFIMYINELYPRLLSKKLIRFNRLFLWIYSCLIIISPIKFYSYLFISYLLITILTLSVIAFRAIISSFKEKNNLYPGAISLIFLTTAVADIVSKYFYNYSSYFMYLAILIFLLSVTYLMAVRNIESSKNNERLGEQLKRNNLLKDEFLSHIAKELKSPMISIIGLTEAIVSDSTPLSSEQLLNTRLINYSAIQLSHLIDELSDYSRLNNDGIILDKNSVNIKQLLDIIILIEESSLEDKKVNIINNLPDGFPMVHGDINRLQQIFTNIIEASIKTLSTGTVTISGKEKEEIIEIIIEDTGSGLPFWKLNNLFNLYSIKDKEDAAFSNLSLHLTKKLIELHEGTIEVFSTLGNGTSFTLTLPKAADKPEGSPSSNSAAFQSLIESYVVMEEAAISFESTNISHKILIIDNDIAAGRLIENHLAAEGYHVISVSKGREAMSIIDNIEDIDLVLINLFIPDISGIDLCTYIREVKSPNELPILMLTSSIKSEELILSFQAGANDYLIKPAEKTELLARVRTLLSLKEYYRENYELNNRINSTTKKMADLTDDINRVMEMDMLKTEFFSNISHELKTPLNVIWTSVQLLKSLNTNDSGLSKYLPIMNQNCLRLIRLINNIIDITKIDGKYLQMDITNDDIVYVVEEIVQSVVSYGETQGITIIFDTEIEEKIMSFDQEKIERIILNLLSNAIKFTPRGGTIEVIMREVEDDIEIVVKDSGIGIPENKLEVIFDRFAQVDKSLSRKREGSGIGLSLVKSLVELHEGTIVAESVYGQGSSFIINLPARCTEMEESSLYDKLIPTSNKVDKINIEFSDIYSY
ncbi:ATP-binding protein [Alloiococcus sp. CFN-8]|uniref:ATP-binding protein n=1 Tax=Alloiococcus sp. CFN-8 TaxID=3416081 RepID=UPI003CECF896